MLKLTMIFIALIFSPFSMAIDLNFQGDLVSLPCVVATESLAQTVDFDVITTKNLYLHQRTTPKPFTVKLVECDPTIAKTVELIFAGSGSVEQPGLLALDSNSSSAAGVAIGLQFANKDLPLGASTGKLNLAAGVTVFNFSAFVQGSPDAIANKKIKEGDFSSTAQFSLNYP